MSRSAQAVADHYKRRALGDVILAALTAAGIDIEHLTPDDLAPVDEFHSGGRNATMRLAQLAQINGSERVLDVGCGIGGPSRYLASTFGCQVTGLDLTQEFVALAAMLAQRTRLADKVTYRQGVPFTQKVENVVIGARDATRRLVARTSIPECADKLASGTKSVVVTTVDRVNDLGKRLLLFLSSCQSLGRTLASD